MVDTGFCHLVPLFSLQSERKRCEIKKEIRDDVSLKDRMMWSMRDR